MFKLHWLDLTLIGAYLALMVYMGKVLSTKIKSESDYYLAGKSLPWYIIGLSIIGTNIGSNDYLGASGGAYRIGIAQANFEWIGAI
ncbi:MAG TPA: sodium/glucose cotransporter, partial [Leptospiraceae bacterium]|nr:sodium/glucose cotransporter [Leptospiraceae bacterium]